MTTIMTTIQIKAIMIVETATSTIRPIDSFDIRSGSFSVGAPVGAIVGEFVGDRVGERVGAFVGGHWHT